MLTGADLQRYLRSFYKCGNQGPETVLNTHTLSATDMKLKFLTYGPVLFTLHFITFYLLSSFMEVHIVPP